MIDDAPRTEGLGSFGDDTEPELPTQLIADLEEVAALPAHQRRDAVTDICAAALDGQYGESFGAVVRQLSDVMDSAMTEPADTPPVTAAREGRTAQRSGP